MLENKNNTSMGVSTTGVLAICQHLRHVSNRSLSAARVCNSSHGFYKLCVEAPVSETDPSLHDTVTVSSSLDQTTHRLYDDERVGCIERLLDLGEFSVAIDAEQVIYLADDEVGVAGCNAENDSPSIVTEKGSLVDGIRKLFVLLNDRLACDDHDYSFGLVKHGSTRIYISYHIITKKAIVYYV